MIVGVIFYIGFLFALLGVEDRLPQRFIDRKLPGNTFLYLKLASLALFLFLTPAYLFLMKIRKRLVEIKAGSEQDLNQIWSDFHSLFVSLIIPWLIYAAIMFYMGYRISKFVLVSF